MWLVFAGGAITVVGVLIQAFSIAAYVRGAGEAALDAHGGFSMRAIGELTVLIGAIGAWWGNWAGWRSRSRFLVLAFAQVAFLGDTEKEGGWINGLHGLLALVILLAGRMVPHPRRREFAVVAEALGRPTD